MTLVFVRCPLPEETAKRRPEESTPQRTIIWFLGPRPSPFTSTHFFLSRAKKASSTHTFPDNIEPFWNSAKHEKSFSRQRYAVLDETPRTSETVSKVESLSIKATSSSNFLGGSFIDASTVPVLSENVDPQSLHFHLCRPCRLLPYFLVPNDPHLGHGLPIRKTSCVWIPGGREQEVIAKQRFSAATRNPVVWQKYYKAKTLYKSLSQQHFCKSFYLFLNLFGFVSCFFQKGSANERETVCGESHERSTGLEPEITVFRGCSFRLAKPNF